MQSVPGNLEQGAARRKWHALFKGCNAVPGHLGHSLRARRDAVIRFVAPFDQGRALACKARRATNRFTPRCIHHSYVNRPPIIEWSIGQPKDYGILKVLVPR